MTSYVLLSLFLQVLEAVLSIRSPPLLTEQSASASSHQHRPPQQQQQEKQRNVAGSVHSSAPSSPSRSHWAFRRTSADRVAAAAQVDNSKPAATGSDGGVASAASEGRQCGTELLQIRYV